MQRCSELHCNLSSQLPTFIVTAGLVRPAPLRKSKRGIPRLGLEVGLQEHTAQQPLVPHPGWPAADVTTSVAGSKNARNRLAVKARSSLHPQHQRLPNLPLLGIVGLAACVLLPVPQTHAIRLLPSSLALRSPSLPTTYMLIWHAGQLPSTKGCRSS